MSLLRSFSVKMALGYVAIFTLSALMLYAVIYVCSVYFPLRTLEQSLSREMFTLEQVYAAEGQPGLVSALKRRVSRPDEYAAMQAFIAADGVVGTANIRSWPRYSGAAWLRLEADTYAEGLEYDRLGLMLDRRFADGSRLLLGRDIDEIDEIEENLQEAAIWFGAASMVLSMIGSVLLRRAIEGRLHRISAAALRVMQGHLSERIATDGSNDEFDRLSQTLNAMLDRIDTLFDAVRRVSDNVAHELRTPLTRMLAQTEALDSAPDADNAARIGAIAEEARRLQRIFDALLRISRLESGRHKLVLRPVNLAEICADAVDYYAPALEAISGSISISGSADIVVRADADLVFQAVANLVDNALKYGGSQPTIRLCTRVADRRAVIDVSDNGVGLDRQDMERCFERFYRGANAAGQPGEGLGLAFVQTVAHVHGGEFRIARSEITTVASLAFPFLAGSELT